MEEIRELRKEADEILERLVALEHRLYVYDGVGQHSKERWDAWDCARTGAAGARGVSVWLGDLLRMLGAR